VTWEPIWEPEELKDTLPNLLWHLKEAHEDEPDFFWPKADQTLDYLERQGFDMSDKPNPWDTKVVDSNCKIKVTFDINPTNPQVDIKPTRNCEFPKPLIEKPSFNTYPPPLNLPDTLSSIYSTDGKCQGMMTSERLNILHTAFRTAKL